jgi:hypothetical protein
MSGVAAAIYDAGIDADDETSQSPPRYLFSIRSFDVA